jgi:hypothetical protein
MRRVWRRWSWHTIDMGQAHQIIELTSVPTWSLVVRGPVRRRWGFYEPRPMPGGRESRVWVYHQHSDPARRDLVATKVSGGGE